MDLSHGELRALRLAAELAWGDDTRHPSFQGCPDASAGQCYVTARWIADRLGGHVLRQDGHFVAVVDHRVVDIASHEPAITYGPLPRHSHYIPWPEVDEPRAEKFSKRANRIFDNLESYQKLADMMGDAYIGDTPQKQDEFDLQYNHDAPAQDPSSGEYNFVYANGSMEISPDHQHDELAQHADLPTDHAGPLAVGKVYVMGNRATWQVTGNVSPRALLRVFKDYTSHVGWEWGGLTALDGEPLDDDFAPKKARRLFFAYEDDELVITQSLGALGDWVDEPRIAGYLTIADEDTVTVTPLKSPAYLPVLRHVAKHDEADVATSLLEWTQDSGFTLLGMDNNVIKRVEDLEEGDLYTPNPTSDDSAFFPKSITPNPPIRQPGGVYKCEHCEQIFPTWRMYQKHRLDQEQYGDQPVEDGGFPSADPSPMGDGAHYTEMRQEPGITTGSWQPPEHDDFTEGERVRGKDGRGGTVVETFANGAIVRVQWDNDPRGVTDIGAVNLQRETHPDPWMDNEPGATTFPEHWSSFNDFWRPDAKNPWYQNGSVKCMNQGCPQTFWRVGAAYRPAAPISSQYTTMECPSCGIRLDQSMRPRMFSCILDRKGVTAYSHGQMVARGEYGQIDPSWPPLLIHKVARGSGQQAKDMIAAPMPFVYDVDKDNINVGNPGQRTSDVPGQFTPDGIVEGFYEPGGKIVIHTMTNMPYTVRHLLELWYATNPMFEVTSVHLQDDSGSDTKLANVGGYLSALVAADPVAHAAATALQVHGGQVYVVGGAVRDALLGKDPHDLDLMVTGLPSEHVRKILAALPGSVDYTGKDFGVYRYKKSGVEVEVAIPRRERSTGPEHQDFDVQADHTMTPEEDLYRRDFTANAMAVHIATGKLVDPFGGAQDIATGALRTLGDHSLAEDPLRVLRAVVAHGKHGLVPDDQTAAQMKANAPSLRNLSAERVQIELDKLFGSADPVAGVRLAHETGVLRYVLPEVEDAFGFDQRNPHHELELGEHLLSVLARTCELSQDSDLRLAALLHDIGKPASAWQDPDPGRGFHYYYSKEHDLGADHEIVGAEMAEARLLALRYPHDRVARIVGLVRHHMFGAFDTKKGARKFLNKTGSLADDLLILRIADQGGKGIQYPHNETLTVEKQASLVKAVREAHEPTATADLAISGHDLIAEGIKPGPRMGQILAHLTDKVVDDPSLNTSDALLTIAREFEIL